MAGMILMPTPDGLQKLKEHTKEGLQKAILLDRSKKKIAEFEIFTSYYDGNGVLTALFDIPNELDLTTPAEYLYVVANDIVIATGKLPTPITFIKGVGGIQTLKFPIKGEAGDVVFKNNHFITEVEFEERYLSGLINLYNYVKTLEKKLLEAEIKEINSGS